EGWDQPNVFQIVKMRSSGSEVSKLQEVGRGLRLPVDELGARPSGEEADEFFLTYLVDFSEKKFAEELIKEINGDIELVLDISPYLEKLAADNDMTVDQFKGALMYKGYIDGTGAVIPSKFEELIERYPVLDKGLNKTRIIDEGDKNGNGEGAGVRNSPKKVGIKPEAFRRLRSLWEELNKKHIIALERATDKQLDGAMDYILNEEIYVPVVRTIREDTVVKNGDGLAIDSQVKTHYALPDTISYKSFLRRAFDKTALPIDTIHRGFVRFFVDGGNERPQDFFNVQTL